MAPSLLLFTLPQQLGRGALPTQSVMIINLMVAYPRKTIVWAASPAGAVVVGGDRTQQNPAGQLR